MTHDAMPDGRRRPQPMWVDETDLTQLAQRLRVGPGELLSAIGGPWFVMRRDESDEMLRPGTLFVGRAGPSVGILIDDGDRLLRIGPSSGQWHGPATLRWAIVEPIVELAVPGVDAAAADVDALVARLGTTVDAVAAEQAARLVTCRYCGSVVAPEHALGDELCQACGSRVFGIVY